MELTTEQKARVYAQHIGCPLVVPYKPKEHWYPFDQNEGGLRLDGVIGGRIFVHRIAETVTDKYRQCYLLLRPLSDITDEDASELVKAIEPDSSYHKVTKLYPGGDCPCLLVEYNSPNLKDWTELYIEFDGTRLPSFAREYLIQKGYAVPCYIAPSHPLNGKNPIELGLAIESE